MAGSLSHPNIVTVHDYFEHEGTPYISMEYIERGSLRPLVGKLTFAQVGGVLEGLLAGLQHAVEPRDRPPRHEARERDGHRRGRRQDLRLRDRPRAQPGRPGLTLPHRHRHRDRDARLHGARAGDGEGGGAVDRPLLARDHGLRDGARRGAVQRLGHADVDARPARQRADPGALDDRPVDRPAARRVDRVAAEEGSEGAAAESAQEALGQARGDRHPPARPALAPRGAPPGARRARARRGSEAAHAGAVLGGAGPGGDARAAVHDLRRRELGGRGRR